MPTDPSPKKIMVVDDEPTHLLCAREILEGEGYRVVTHDGAFGVTEKVMREAPDLLLLDVNMPALSGEGLVNVLRRRDTTRGTRILLYSSNDEAALRKTADRLSLAGYVPKGDPGELRRMVAWVLQDATAQPR